MQNATVYFRSRGGRALRLGLRRELSAADAAFGRVERSAREVGANASPAAQLSLKNTQDQIATARKAMEAGDNQRADALLKRAQADGELALAQARETMAHVDRQEAVQDSADQKATNIGQGAVK